MGVPWAAWGSFGELWGAFRGPWGPFGVLWEAFGGPLGVFWGSLGACGASLGGRVDSWALRGRFPGFSGKFWEPCWLHFDLVSMIFRIFCSLGFCIDFL